MKAPKRFIDLIAIVCLFFWGLFFYAEAKAEAVYKGSWNSCTVEFLNMTAEELNAKIQESLDGILETKKDPAGHIEVYTDHGIYYIHDGYISSDNPVLCVYENRQKKINL
tara:strand:- start:520 stop:849 length:330 start_codon:yes stop_codon:yes gene_type:complete